MRPKPHLGHTLAAALYVFAAGSLQAQANPPSSSATWKDPVDLPAEVMPLAQRGLLLDLVEADDGMVAVGERGTVLFAPRYTTNWTQIADVPTRVTLTAVTCGGANKLWAVGHDGVIIASVDGGKHWTLQHKDPWRPPSDGETDEPDPRQGAPLLDVVALDENHVIAVGAYSLMLVTHDGGARWNTQSIADRAASDAATATKKEGWTFSKQELAIGDESDPHFNAIARVGADSLFIAGERGVAFRSRDRGKTWGRVRWPYEGSMFGAIGFEDQHVLTFGLRGHAYESDDLGDHWREVNTGTELSLLGGTHLSDNGVAIVGANGLVLVRRSGSDAFRAGTVHPSGALVGVYPQENVMRLVIVGENGIGTFGSEP